MAASNLPWDLDIAVLRRLEKRVLVPLPVPKAREEMFRKHLSDRCRDDVDFSAAAQATEGYSGADIELVCRESAMMPVRRLMTKIATVGDTAVGGGGIGSSSGVINLAHEGMIPDPPPAAVRGNNLASGGRRAAAAGTGSSTATATAAMLNSMQDINALLKQDPVSPDDIYTALGTTKPSSDGKIDKYVLITL